jgi:2'-5' RNA ligase
LGVGVTRLAVAIRPPADVVELLRALPRPPTPRVTWAAPEQLMVKLRPLGHVDPGLVDPLVEALRDELAGAPAVTCTLGPATCRSASQWLAVPVTGLDDLAAAVFDATVGIVPVTHPQPFRADVVVARGRAPATLAGVPVHATWSAQEVALVADRSAPGHPHLVDLAAFPLGGGKPPTCS